MSPIRSSAFRIAAGNASTQSSRDVSVVFAGHAKISPGDWVAIWSALHDEIGRGVDVSAELQPTRVTRHVIVIAECCCMFHSSKVGELE